MGTGPRRRAARRDRPGRAPVRRRCRRPDPRGAGVAAARASSVRQRSTWPASPASSSAPAPSRRPRRPSTEPSPPRATSGDGRLASTARLNLARLRRAAGDASGRRCRPARGERTLVRRRGGRGRRAVEPVPALCRDRRQSWRCGQVLDEAGAAGNIEVQVYALDAMACAAAAAGRPAARPGAARRGRRRWHRAVVHLVDDHDRLDRARARELMAEPADGAVGRHDATGARRSWRTTGHRCRAVVHHVLPHRNWNGLLRASPAVGRPDRDGSGCRGPQGRGHVLHPELPGRRRRASAPARSCRSAPEWCRHRWPACSSRR